MEIETYRIKNGERWQKCTITIIKGKVRNVETDHDGLHENLRVKKPTDFELEEILKTDDLYMDYEYNYNIIYNNWRDGEYTVAFKLSKIDLLKIKWSKGQYYIQEKSFLKDIILVLFGALLGYLFK